MGDWYVVLKKIKGNLYAYRQKTFRQGSAVKTVNVYIGRADHLNDVIQKKGLLVDSLKLSGHPAWKVQTLSPREADTAYRDSRLVKMLPVEWLPQTRRSIDAYTSERGICYRQINAALRGDEPMTSAVKRHVLALRAALYDERAVLMENVTLFRTGVLPLHECRIGGKFKQSHIVSFSTDEVVTNYFTSYPSKGYVEARFKLIAKQGDKRYIDTGTAEKEIITTGGLFEIVQISKKLGKLHITVVKVEEVI